MLGPPPLVPSTFEIPLKVETDDFILRPLTVDRFYLDFESYMSSIEHLQKTFDLEGEQIVLDGEIWPANSDVEFAVIDAAWCHMEWKIFRSSFTYTALNKSETKQLGCGYIFPSYKKGYDLRCETWVRADEYENGFGQPFYEWFRAWVEGEWPFSDKVIGWPGQEIPWDTWNSIPDEDGAIASAG